MNFQEFEQREHQKRVDHFVRFVQSTGNAPSLENAMHVFGIVERDAKPIARDARAAL